MRQGITGKTGTVKSTDNQKCDYRDSRNKQVYVSQRQAKERLLKDTLPVNTLALLLTANLTVQTVISQLDDSPHFRQASIHHIGDPTGEFLYLINEHYKIIPTRQLIYDIHTK